MEQRDGIAERIARAKQRARGDPFGVTADWEVLLALSEATWAHYQASKTKEAAEDYLSMIEDAASIVSAEGMRVLREQHIERVRALAPGSPTEMTLTQPPPLGMDPALFENMVEGLRDYEPPTYIPQEASVGVEPMEPVRVGRAGRVREAITGVSG